MIRMFFFFKFYRTVLEKSTFHIDTVLTYCRCTMHDTGLLDYMQFFEVRIHFSNEMTMCFKAWFPYAAELPAELPATVPI